MSGRKFPVVVGALSGTGVVILYLWQNYSDFAHTQITSPPDPVWTVLVNIILILFVSIFSAVRMTRFAATVSKFLNRKWRS